MKKSQATPRELTAKLERAFTAYRDGQIYIALSIADEAIGGGASDAPGIPPVISKLRQLRGVIFANHLDDYPRAIVEFVAALEAAPGDHEVRICLIACYSNGHIADWDRVIETARPLLDADDDATVRFAYETIIQALLISSCSTTAAYRDYVKMWSRRFIEPRLLPISHSPKRVPPNPSLRIGFVHRVFSSNLYHALFVPFFQELRRCGATVVAISTAAAEYTAPSALQDGIDHWLNISGLDDASAVRSVAALDLDVLVNLDGFSAVTRFGLFMQRPAPLLVSWHNTHYTFGRGMFDCIIADTTVLSEVERQEYAEDIIDLEPCYFSLVPPANSPPVSPSPALESKAIVFGTMNRPGKISPEAAESWNRILNAVPESWLFLRNGQYEEPFSVDWLRSRLHAAGISADRVVISGKADHYQFLESYGLIDIALDSFPFGGGFTTFQALWQGVPVVTFPGERWAARVSTSILRACELPELIAPDRRGYEALAVNLAKDMQRVSALRSSMRGRIARSSFVDMANFAKKFLSKLREKLHDRYSSPTI